VLLEHPLLARQILVDAVPQFVGQGHHVAGVAGEVHEDVGVRGRHRRRAVGPAALARVGRRVNPRPGEELPGDLGHRRVKLTIRAQHHLAGLRPLVAPFGSGQRRVAVVVVEPVHPQQRPLEMVIASHDVVARSDSTDQRLHHVVADLVFQVARGDPAWEMAQAVVGGFVGGQRVEDEGQRGQLPAQHVGESLGRALANVAVWLVQLGQDRRLSQFFAVEGVARVAYEFREKACPRAAPGDRLLRQDFLLRLAEAVRLVAARHLKPVAVMGQRRVAQHGLGEPVRRVDPF